MVYRFGRGSGGLGSAEINKIGSCSSAFRSEIQYDCRKMGAKWYTELEEVAA